MFLKSKNLYMKYFFVQNECSFVSLRDVDRLLTVMMWFYENRQLIFSLMNERATTLRHLTKYKVLLCIILILITQIYINRRYYS